MERSVSSNSHMHFQNLTRPRSRSSIVQFPQAQNDQAQRPCSPSTCRVSDCWSPTSDMDPCMVSGRPLGGLEKVIEYRPVPNGHGIELRRLTASADGPIEHIQVVPQQMHPTWVMEGPPPPAPPPPPSNQPFLNGSQPCLIIPEAEANEMFGYYGGQPMHQHVFMDPHGPLMPPPPPMAERQRSLPRSNGRRQKQQMQQHSAFEQPQQPLTPKSRTSSMGKLDPRASGSQPCLLVAQTVSNRRKRQAQEQQSLNKIQGGQSSKKANGSSKKSFHRSESFHQQHQQSQQQPLQQPQQQQQQQSHFFVNTQMDEPPLMHPPPPVATPSYSPISVVRNKRANQANWEKHQRKNSTTMPATKSMEVNGGHQEAASESVENCVSGGLVTPILGSASCTRRQSTEDEEDDDEDLRTDDQMTEDSHADDLTVPPPPSPPCTCGKNLELPPTPPLDDLEANGQFHGKSFSRLSTTRCGHLRNSQPQPELWRCGL